jgi:hypothetical protein
MASLLRPPLPPQATIAEVKYEALGAPRIGVCSTFVADRLALGHQVPVYIHKNPDFRLPASPATPIIMVRGSGKRQRRAPGVMGRVELGSLAHASRDRAASARQRKVRVGADRQLELR